MPNKMMLNAEIDITGNARCSIVRHSTLWLKPVLLGQFEFTEWTPDNHLRHYRFVALREDKKPMEVRRTSLVAAKREEQGSKRGEHPLSAHAELP